jgi:hypothetical protein
MTAYAWLAPGLVALLHQSEKRIHADVDDLALPHGIGHGIPIRPFGLDHFPVSISIPCEHGDQAARPPSTFFSPRATMIKASSGKGR